MSYGISVHIGLNKIDPAFYGGTYPLVACHNDAKDMMKIAKQKKFDESYIYLDAKGTSATLSKHLNDAAKKLKKGDFLLLTYSGHGSYVPDNNKDEKDGNDETWCLYDRMFIDDELASHWAKFKVGVKILMLSDSCHSGTVSRILKSDGTLEDSSFDQKSKLIKEGPQIFKKNKKVYSGIKAVTKNIAKTDNIRATVILLSGCQDNQTSLDGNVNGLFTEKLLKVYNKGKFKGNYAGLLTGLLKLMPSNQTPNYSLIGRRNLSFENAAPFVK